jgi:hypothetical protein
MQRQQPQQRMQRAGLVQKALDALGNANEEITETISEKQRQRRGSSGKHKLTSKFSIEQVLKKFTMNDDDHDQEKKKKKKRAIKIEDVREEFQRQWSNAYQVCDNEYEVECALADSVLICNEWWLQNSLQEEGALIEDELFQWKCARVCVNDVKQFVNGVMQWPGKKKFVRIVDDLREVRDAVLKKARFPLRTYEQVIAQVARVCRNASLQVMNEARKTKGKTNEKKKLVEEAREFEKELRMYVEQSWQENGLPTLPEKWFEKQCKEMKVDDDDDDDDGDDDGDGGDVAKLEIAAKSPVMPMSNQKNNTAEEKSAPNTATKKREREQQEEKNVNKAAVAAAAAAAEETNKKQKVSSAVVQKEETETETEKEKVATFSTPQPPMKVIEEKEEEKKVVAVVSKDVALKNDEQFASPVAAAAVATTAVKVAEVEATKTAKEKTKVTFTPKILYDADEDDALLKRLPEPMQFPPNNNNNNNSEQLVAVTLKVRCHDLDADVALIPLNPPTNGFKTSAEMAELLAEAAIGPESSTIPAVDNISETCPTEPWIPGRGSRCLRNDGKLWRCSFKACDEDSMFCNRHADVSFGKNLSRSEIENEANKQREKTVEKYQGLPATVVVLSVGKIPVSVDALGGARLCDPEIFEEHAFRAHCGVANAGGKFVPRKKIVKDEDEDEDSFNIRNDTNTKNMGNEYFRANALVREREGAWTNFRDYEHKLLSNIPGMTPGASIVRDEAQKANIMACARYANEKRKVAIEEAFKTNTTRDRSDPTILSLVGGKTPTKVKLLLDVNGVTPPGKQGSKAQTPVVTEQAMTPPKPSKQQKERKDVELLALYTESNVMRDSLLAAKVARESARKETGVNSEDYQIVSAQVQSLEDAARSLAIRITDRLRALNMSLHDLEKYCTEEVVIDTPSPAAVAAIAPIETPKPYVALSIINSIKGEGYELDNARDNLRECCTALSEVHRTTKAMQQSAIDHVNNSRQKRSSSSALLESDDDTNEEKGETFYTKYATSIEHALVCAAEMTRWN